MARRSLVSPDIGPGSKIKELLTRSVPASCNHSRKRCPKIAGDNNRLHEAPSIFIKLDQYQ